MLILNFRNVICIAAVFIHGGCSTPYTISENQTETNLVRLIQEKGEQRRQIRIQSRKPEIVRAVDFLDKKIEFVDSTAVPIPAQSILKPRKQFGPFREGSDFGQILLRLPGQSSQSSIYFNNFFATLDPTSVPIYRQYFPDDQPNNQVPQPITSPELVGQPGGLPGPVVQGVSQFKFGEVELALAGIQFTSKHGGSIALHFRANDRIVVADTSSGARTVMTDEDFGYELGTADKLYDIDGLRLTAYVTPFHNPIGGPLHDGLTDFNPITSQHYVELWHHAGDANSVNFTFKYGDFVAYASDGNGARNARAIPRTAAQEDEINRSLEAMAIELKKPQHQIQRACYKFAHAFVHDQWQAAFAGDATTDKVIRIYLSDDFCELVTQKRHDWLSVAWELTNVEFRENHDPDEDLNADVSAVLRRFSSDKDETYVNHREGNRNTGFWEESRDTRDWRVSWYGGIWSVSEELPHIEEFAGVVRMGARPHTTLPLLPDLKWSMSYDGPFGFRITPDHAAIQTAVASGSYGLYWRGSLDFADPGPDMGGAFGYYITDEWRGKISVQLSLTLQ